MRELLAAADALTAEARAAEAAGQPAGALYGAANDLRLQAIEAQAAAIVAAARETTARLRGLIGSR